MPKSKKTKPSRQQRRDAARARERAASRQNQFALSASHQARGVELLRRLDTHAPLREKLKTIAAERDDWSGIPMPLSDEQLVMEPRHPYAALSAIGHKPEEPVDFTVRNSWHSTHKRCRVTVVQMADGRIRYALDPEIHHFTHDLKTMGCSEAWGIEQESKAIDLLGTLLRHHAFKKYLLTGMFLETSKRSGLTYVFRKLRPTVVLKSVPGQPVRILCALCLHPIAYYAGSWAGAMCPTDDVVAHLMLMRGDEAMLWRRANHHPAWSPLAGL